MRAFILNFINLSILLSLAACNPSSDNPTSADTETKHGIHFQIRSLPNLGNTCWLNTTLQIIRRANREQIYPRSHEHSEALLAFERLMSSFPMQSPGPDREV